jgi:hypothetical protein
LYSNFARPSDFPGTEPSLEAREYAHVPSTATASGSLRQVTLPFGRHRRCRRPPRGSRAPRSCRALTGSPRRRTRMAFAAPLLPVPRSDSPSRSPLAGLQRWRSCVSPPTPPTPPPPPPPSHAARRLEQSWRFQHRNDLGGGGGGDSIACLKCRGSGVDECKFCSATGLLTLGDKILCSVSGGTKCPVCRGSGYQSCSGCSGCGQIAKWIVL